MKKVSASEARTHFYHLLESAARGESVAITRRGDITAILKPLPTDGDVMSDAGRMFRHVSTSDEVSSPEIEEGRGASP